MIENEELGLKVAENKEEAFWLGVKEKALNQIELMKHEITINEAVVKLAEEKIEENKKVVKDGK